MPRFVLKEEEMATLELRKRQIALRDCLPVYKTVFRAKIRLKGTEPVSGTFDRKTDALRWVQQTEAAIRDGRYFKTAEAQRHTVADLVDRYQQEVLPHKAKGTILVQAMELNWWKAKIGHLSLAEVTPAVLCDYRNQLSGGDGTKRCASTIIHYFASLSHAFNTAIQEWQWCDENPVCRIKKPRLPRGRVRYLSDEGNAQSQTQGSKTSDSMIYAIAVRPISR
jgi:hypothetical protein